MPKRASLAILTLLFCSSASVAGKEADYGHSGVTVGALLDACRSTEGNHTLGTGCMMYILGVSDGMISGPQQATLLSGASVEEANRNGTLFYSRPLMENDRFVVAVRGELEEAAAKAEATKGVDKAQFKALKASDLIARVLMKEWATPTQSDGD